jgi:ADP-heptose:LPS heptosyltransferase
MKFLIIQTAFIGDVVLATPMAEALDQLDNVEVHFLVRKGNESLLENNPFIDRVWIWNKQQNKIRNLFQLGNEIRNEKFDCVINLQRFASTGFLTWRSGALNKIGFQENPFSFCFSLKFKHEVNNGLHEVNRNLELLREFVPGDFPPRLFPSVRNFEKVAEYKSKSYVCVAPSSVWFTKQWPKANFIQLVKELSNNHHVFLLGAKSDFDLCEEVGGAENLNTTNLSGKLNFLESAALMRDAAMNFVNDSAPLHFASAMNAPTTAFFCSTIPEFGFGPLSERSRVVESEEHLECRPCGLHGKKSCPLGHFKCGEISFERIEILAQC